MMWQEQERAQNDSGTSTTRKHTEEQEQMDQQSIVTHDSSTTSKRTSSCTKNFQQHDQHNDHLDNNYDNNQGEYDGTQTTATTTTTTAVFIPATKPSISAQLPTNFTDNQNNHNNNIDYNNYNYPSVTPRHGSNSRSHDVMATATTSSNSNITTMTSSSTGMMTAGTPYHQEMITPDTGVRSYLAKKKGRSYYPNSSTSMDLVLQNHVYLSSHRRISIERGKLDHQESVDKVQHSTMDHTRCTSSSSNNNKSKSDGTTLPPRMNNNVPETPMMIQSKSKKQNNNNSQQQHQQKIQNHTSLVGQTIQPTPIRQQCKQQHLDDLPSASSSSVKKSMYQEETVNEVPTKRMRTMTPIKTTTIATPTTSNSIMLPIDCIFQVGDIVQVKPRTWPGINKPGGIARVKKVHLANTTTSQVNVSTTTYDVAYVLGGREKQVPAQYVRLVPLELGTRSWQQPDGTIQQQEQQRQSPRMKARKTIGSTKKRKILMESNSQQRQHNETPIIKPITTRNQDHTTLPEQRQDPSLLENAMFIGVTPSDRTKQAPNEGSSQSGCMKEVGISENDQSARIDVSCSHDVTLGGIRINDSAPPNSNQQNYNGVSRIPNQIIESSSKINPRSSEVVMPLKKRRLDIVRTNESTLLLEDERHKQINTEQQQRQEDQSLPSEKQPEQQLAETWTESQVVEVAQKSYDNRIQAALKKSRLCIVSSKLSEQDTLALHKLVSQSKTCSVRLIIMEDLKPLKTTLCLVPCDPHNSSERNAVALHLTRKVMLAALAGVPIITPAWIHACLDSKRLIAPTASMFIRSLCGSVSPTSTNFGVPFTVAKLIQTNGNYKPLTNHQVYLCGSFTPNSKSHDIQVLLQKAGAVFLTDEASLLTSLQLTSSNENQLLTVLLCDGTATSLSERIRKAVERLESNHLATRHNGRVLVVDSFWLLDSISAGRTLDARNYRPTSPSLVIQKLWQLTTGSISSLKRDV